MSTSSEDTLSAATAKHCAPICFGNVVTKILESADYIDGQGTVTFVSFEGKLYGITNQHVVGDDYKPFSVDKMLHLILDQHKPITNHLIFESKLDDPDFPLDIAIFDLDDNILDGTGKIPFKLKKEPSIDIREGDLGLAVGFPKFERAQVDATHMAHPLYHVASTCIVDSDKIILYDSLPEDKKDVRFGGMSGGPIFGFNEMDQYNLVGIVFQGRGFGDVDPQQPLSDDMWVWGFRFDYNWMAKILASPRIM